ncbi:hypothetical protein [methane-oxidizing endosymbiont of Gigantopelta aegis]|uniref:hypothetical protein n=1 Tax=methane-oxidizing endosymbiont of Gigantopelta aegis TaxID=2794938 RepID=UPI001FD924FA|nr:hypothetical protein [methane-oxidizing endosymbiont of Gigantopelta aegis]
MITNNSFNKSLSVSIEQETVSRKLLELLDDAIKHDGYGDIRVEVKILKRKQKEVIIHYGRQYRFVIDMPLKQPAQVTGHQSNDGDEGSHPLL